MQWKVPNMWEGGKCFIIGGGSSLIEQFNISSELVEAVKSGESTIDSYAPYLSDVLEYPVIAVNEAFKISPKVDVLFFGDGTYWKRESNNIVKFNGLKVTCASELKDRRGIKYVPQNKKKNKGITTDANYLSWNANSGAAAINIAYHFGAKEMYLIGFDMDVSQANNQHWHNSYNSNPKSVKELYGRHLAGFPLIRKELDTLGVKVINLNPNSAVDAFEKLSWKEYKDNQRFTIIIPSMFYHIPRLMKCVALYESTDLIAEVLIINNNKANQPDFSRFAKVKVLGDGNNLFVNPSWNLGVKQAKTAGIIIANDDIEIEGDLQATLKAVNLKLHKGMVFGPAKRCFTQLTDIGIEGEDLSTMSYGAGTFMILRKEDYKPIPEQLKIWYGDRYHFDQMEMRMFTGIRIKTEMKGTTSKLDLQGVAAKEKQYYNTLEICIKLQ